MNVVVCPHCGQSVSIDSSIAGQVIGCPTCKGQFQTPAMALPMPPPLPPKPMPGPGPTYPLPPYPVAAQRAPGGFSGTQLALLIGGGVGLLLLLPCCICTLPGLLRPQANVAPPVVNRPKDVAPAEVREAVERKVEELKQPKEQVRKTEQPRKTEPEPESKQLTYDKFMQVKNGMSKREVIAILGANYEVLSENEIGVGTDFYTHTEMLSWKQSGLSFGNCNVMIQNGKVMSKAQFGLK